MIQHNAYRGAPRPPRTIDRIDVGVLAPLPEGSCQHCGTIDTGSHVGAGTRVLQRVAFEMGIHVSAIVGETRAARFVRARAAIAWLARALYGAPDARIGRVIGNRHHTTIIALIGRAEEWRAKDPAFRLLTDRLVEEMAP